MPKIEKPGIIVPGKEPVAYLCPTRRGIEGLLDKARSASKGERFVLLLRGDRELQNRILPAFLNSYVRYREGSMKSATLQIELMLFIAGTLNIGRAISECGARDGVKLLVVASDDKALERFLKGSGIRDAKRLGLKMGYTDFHPALR
jgi:hypothetical protein